MRKTDIRARTRALNAALLNGALRASQEDERQRLIEACRVAGDHDFNRSTFHPVTSAETLVAWHSCQFCGVMTNATQEQVRRNLTTY